MTVLFQTWCRRGIGHLMRGLNIADALIEQEPTTRALFHLNAPPPTDLWSGAYPCVTADPERPETSWEATLARTRPALTLFDTMPPDSPRLGAELRVFVMRNTAAARRRELLTNPRVASCDRILIPHDRSDELPPGLAVRTCFTGPIVRAPDPERQARLRRALDIDPQRQLVVSTPGGGGFGEETRRFFEAVTAAHRAIDRYLDDWRHLVVTGPRYDGPRPVEPGMTVVSGVPHLVDLIDLADLVVARAGYNTANELRLTGTPAILLPGRRRHDDQPRRAGALVAEGRALVADEEVEGVADLLRSRDAFDTLCARAQPPQRARGNRRAAQEILALLRSR